MASQPQLAPSLRELESKRLRIFELALVLSVAFALPLLNAIMIFFHGTPSFRPQYAELRLSASVIQQVLILTVFGYVLFRQGSSLEAIGLSFRRNDGLVALVLALGATLAFYVCYVAIYSVYFAINGERLMPWHGTTALFGNGVTRGLVVYVLLAPIVEELIVRGYMITEMIALTKQPAIAIAASVLLQSSYHIYQGVTAAIAHGASFLLFSLYFVRTKRLAPIVLAHILLDIAGFAWAYS